MSFCGTLAMASPESIYVWNDQKGFLPNKQCRAVLTEYSLFQVLISEKKDQDYELLLSRSNNSTVKIENSVLLKVIPEDNSEGHFSYVEIINLTEKTKELNPNLNRIPRYGYMFNGSIQPISYFILEFNEDAPIKHTIAGLTLADTIWQARHTEDQMYMALECEGYSDVNPYLQAMVFDVYSKKAPGVSIATIAIDPQQHQIFKYAKTQWLSRATHIYNIKQNEFNKNASIKLNIYPDYKFKYSQALKKTGTESLEENKLSTNLNLSYGKTSSSVKTNPYVGFTTLPLNNLTAISNGESLEDTGESIDGEVTNSDISDIPTYDSSLEYVVCTQNAILNVRSKENIENVLFEAKRHEAIKPYQGFNGPEFFKATLGNEEYTFVQIEFLERDKDEEKFGWVAVDYVVPKSMCPGYQLTLGDQQPVICTEDSGVNVRDENLNMDQPLFVAEQFEPVALMSNVDEKNQKVTVGEKEYTMIPVVFPNRDNLIGWLAKEFVQVKAQCEPYKKQGECCVFPTHRRPKQTYTNSSIMTSFNYRRAGGDRLHAGTDLYRDLGDPVVSVGPGTVIYGLRYFYLGTYEIAVQHANFIARYGEIKHKKAAGVSAGQEVKAGQTLGYIARIQSLNPMLHFEMYSNRNDTSNELTNKNSNKKYKRRSDLINPTEHLRKWERRTFGASY